LGGLLRELRESQGLSQRELAKKLDRTQAFVWKVEQGIQHLDIPTLMDMAIALKPLRRGYSIRLNLPKVSCAANRASSTSCSNRADS
jgi:transcriptional regulator with XRE-family HTH domain